MILKTRHTHMGDTMLLIYPTQNQGIFTKLQSGTDYYIMQFIGFYIQFLIKNLSTTHIPAERKKALTKR